MMKTRWNATQARPVRLAIGVVALASALGASGCGDDGDTINMLPDTNLPVAVTTSTEATATGHRVVIEAAATGPGGPLTFEWSAPAGRFSDEGAATTGWTAPDEPGTYSLSVVVSDGVRVGIGSANVTVSQYEPTDSPSYRGAVICAGCHADDDAPGGDQFTAWSASDHAHAIESLVSAGVDENGSCLGCHTVGTYGVNADASLDNGGYDETAVPRLAGVQCENCHGPGSEHPQVDFGSTQVVMDAAVCGQCHNGTHHPTFDEWQASGHANVVAFAAGRASCAKCHNGLEAPRYLDDPLNYTPPAEDPSESAPHACAVCHDPHGNENPGNLRNASVTDVVLPNAVLVEAAGAGRLCMSCHNGRRTEDNVADMIENGSGHFGPHHSVQGDMLAGVNANEDVAPDGFAFATSRHILVEDACVTCHAHPNDGDPSNGIPNFTGHTFAPTTEACQPCHGELSAFTDILAKQDYDADGTIEGVQDEVNGLLEMLMSAIIDASNSPEARAAFEEDFEAALGDIEVSTRDQRRAGYNWGFVAFDGSHGVHNATYSIQLLQRSILLLDDTLLPPASLLGGPA